jgi:GT2 family glycosyltransferase
MSRTCAVILNCNLKEHTDYLYETLKPYERGGNYDLLVFDNGSTKEGMSKYTTHLHEENLFFGGGLNAAMQLVLEDEQYDSLLFLNNDLTIHPYHFVQTLREEMFNADGSINFDIIAPAFYNVEYNQPCHWKTMHSYCSPTVREVPFVDFQCPLISKRLIKEIGSLSPDLKPGWGPDFLFAITAKRLGWKLGVVDRCCILHHNSLTVKLGVAGLDMPTYCRWAEAGQLKFFTENNLMKEWQDLRKQAETYSFP